MKEIKEVNITIKGEDSSYKQKFLCYEDITCSTDDKHVKEMIDTACKNAKIVPEDIKVRILMVVK